MTFLNPEHIYHPDPTPEAIAMAARVALALRPPENEKEARAFVRGILNAAAKTGWYPQD